MAIMSKNRSSEEIYRQACEVITGGVSRNTVFRKPFPHYADKASGCYITDIDGTERVDFANNMAALIHGHAHPAIVEAVTRQSRRELPILWPLKSKLLLPNSCLKG
jgi:glutamate-1-semialdehyde 2,1-aminomutase